MLVFAASARCSWSTSIMLATMRSKAPLSQRPVRAHRASHVSVAVHASYTKATTKEALQDAGGKQVVELGGSKILVIQDGGKTAFFQGQVQDKCIVCPAHKTAFDLATGEVKGEWCPNFPQLPLVGKMVDKKPLPTFKVQVEEDGTIKVDV